jgi:hypothetical protein
VLARCSDSRRNGRFLLRPLPMNRVGICGDRDALITLLRILVQVNVLLGYPAEIGRGNHVIDDAAFADCA